MNIKAFAEDLKEAVPIIEGAILGTTEGFFFKTKIQGLSNNQQAFADAKKNLLTLRSALDTDGACSATSTAADRVSIEARAVEVIGAITASGPVTVTGSIPGAGQQSAGSATGDKMTYKEVIGAAETIGESIIIP